MSQMEPYSVIYHKSSPYHLQTVLSVVLFYMETQFSYNSSEGQPLTLPCKHLSVFSLYCGYLSVMPHFFWSLMYRCTEPLL